MTHTTVHMDAVAAAAESMMKGGKPGRLRRILQLFKPSFSSAASSSSHSSSGSNTRAGSFNGGGGGERGGRGQGLLRKSPSAPSSLGSMPAMMNGAAASTDPTGGPTGARLVSGGVSGGSREVERETHGDGVGAKEAPPPSSSTSSPPPSSSTVAGAAEHYFPPPQRLGDCSQLLHPTRLLLAALVR